MSSDAVSSVAYAGEEILIIMAFLFDLGEEIAADVMDIKGDIKSRYIYAK